MRTVRLGNFIQYFAARMGVVILFFGISGCGGSHPTHTAPAANLFLESQDRGAQTEDDMTKITIQPGDRGFNARSE